MTTYTKSTDFAAKDALLTGNPSKVVKGVEINTEFDNIAAADATSLKAGGSLGTPSGGTLTNATGLPISTGVSGLGTGVATFLGTPSSANLAAAVTDETGSGALVFATSPTLVTPALGTPSSGTLTNATGLPISTGVSGLGTGVATFLGTPSSANLAAAVTDETGSGALVFATSPTLVTPALGTPSALVGTNITGTASGFTAGNVLVTNPAGLGYGTGAGGTVTQATSKSTAVTLNKPTGQITMNNAALAAGTEVFFSLTNSLITGYDVVICNLSISLGGSYIARCSQTYTGGATIGLKNITAGSLSESPVINFAVIKGATS